MRPPLISSGNKAIELAGKRKYKASMRPPLISSGNCVFMCLKLERNHGFNEAAAN